jgi:hypothetical protein
MNAPNRLWTITAIVCDPSPNNPLFGGDYFKLIARSSNPAVDVHMERLASDGWRVSSVKSRPYDEYNDNFIAEISDNQGNQVIVDGKRVRHESDNEGGV